MDEKSTNREILKYQKVIAEYKEGLVGAVIALLIEFFSIVIGHSKDTILFSICITVIGFLLTVMRRSIASELIEQSEEVKEALAFVSESRDGLQKISRLSAIIDLNHRTNLTELSNFYDNYFKIVEPEFSAIKAGIVSAASSELARIASQKSSQTLATGEYYTWLWETFARYIEKKASICAISTMLDVEWVKSAEEIKFAQMNLEAAEKECSVERIFIMPRKKLVKALKNPYLIMHCGSDKSKPKGFIILEEDIAEKDPNLRNLVKHGFLCFDRRIMLIDQRGSARGTVVMEPYQVQLLLKAFDSLKTLSTSLTEENIRALLAIQNLRMK